jgi:RHS repeat-associated protein
LTYKYNAFGDLTSVSDPRGTLRYEFDDAGRRLRLRPDGAAPVDYAYDRGGRLQQIASGPHAVVLTYDRRGLRSTVNLPGGVEARYRHDDAGRVAAITYRQAGRSIGSIEYAYDGGGRVAAIAGSLADVALPAALSRATYRASGQLRQWTNQKLAHDKLGRLTGRNGVRLQWSPDDHLESVQGAGVSAQYEYDALGRRVKATVSGAVWTFMYDGPNVLTVTGPSGTGLLLSGLDVDDYHAWIDAQGARSLIRDRLGSVLALTTGRAIANRVIYEPFGRPAHGLPEILGFLGRPTDPTGLIDMRARLYSPEVHRFLTPDPLADNAVLHPYAYAGNSPAGRVDPTGLLDDDAEQIKDAIAQMNQDILATQMQALEIGLGTSIGAIYQKHHIGTHYKTWGEHLGPLYEKARLGMHSEENFVRLVNHSGPHSDWYHFWVKMELEAATEGLSGYAYRAAFVKRLEEIAAHLKANPGMIHEWWWNLP